MGALGVQDQLQGLNSTLKERVAEEARERELLWRNSRDLLAVIDTKGAFQAVSPVVTEILGWTPEDMIGRTMFDFVVEDDQTPTEGALEHERARRRAPKPGCQSAPRDAERRQAHH